MAVKNLARQTHILTIILQVLPQGPLGSLAQLWGTVAGIQQSHPQHIHKREARSGGKTHLLWVILRAAHIYFNAKAIKPIFSLFQWGHLYIQYIHVCEQVHPHYPPSIYLSFKINTTACQLSKIDYILIYPGLVSPPKMWSVPSHNKLTRGNAHKRIT